MPVYRQQRRGLSLIGLLVTFACMAVLSAILLSSLNSSITGAGAVRQNSVYALEDEVNLRAIRLGMDTYAMGNRGRFLVPSELSGRDRAMDTTANFYSALIMAGHIDTRHVVSRHEHSGYVEFHPGYDRTLYDPAAGVFWDPSFKADLQRLSHASFAPMPLSGARLRNEWRQAGNSMFPLLGTRGPRDGVVTAATYTVGRAGIWAGHFAFGDGHVAYVSTMDLPGLTVDGDQGRAPDHVFKMESGGDGTDAILAFTRSMTVDGPELQFD